MAKKKPKVNKTQVIRDYLAENPDTAPKEVAATLSKQGLSVTANYVSTIKTNMKAKGKGKKKVAAKKKAAPKKKAADAKILLSALMEAKKLAAKLGGIEQAKQAINALAQLTD